MEMKAAVYLGIRKIEVRAIELPPLRDNEILIKVEASGVCATDVKAYLRGYPAFKPPIILGHEFAGIVSGVGKSVDVCKKGDRVTVAPYVECGKCIYCKKGDGDVCPHKLYIQNGAFAEYVVISEEFAKRAMIKLDDNLNYQVAALTEPIACCVNALGHVEVEKGDNILIIGAGTMGILNGYLCKIRGAKNVIISDMNEERLKIAEKDFGLRAVNIEKENLAEVVNRLTNSIKCDKVIVAVGSVKVIEDAFNYVRKGGKIHMFGGAPKDSVLEIPSSYIHYSKITLLGSSGFREADFRAAMEIIKKHGDVIRKIITNVYSSLDGVEIAIKNNIEGKSLKSIIKFE